VISYKLAGELQDFVVPGRCELLLRKSIGPLTDFRSRPFTFPP
jgi:hypothetical protein